MLRKKKWNSLKNVRTEKKNQKIIKQIIHSTWIDINL